MRDYRDAKTMAKGLRRSLAELGTELTHSQSLELIAQAFGFDNWNILAAKIEAARPAPAGEKAGANDAPLHCGFCGKSQHDVQTLIAGPNTFICNECVGICDNVLEDNEVLRRLRDPLPGEAPATPLESYLAERTPEQLRTYLERTEGRIAESQKTVDDLDNDSEGLADWLKAKAAPDRAKVRASLTKQLASWRKSVDVVSRTLETR